MARGFGIGLSFKMELQHTGQRSRKQREKSWDSILVHPLSSPDLNAIKFLWLIVQSEVSVMKPKAGNLERLWEQVQAAWGEIEIDTVNQVEVSKEQRRQAMCQARGLLGSNLSNSSP